MATVLKTVGCNSSVGSNPTSSARLHDLLSLFDSGPRTRVTLDSLALVRVVQTRGANKNYLRVSNIS